MQGSGWRVVHASGQRVKGRGGQVAFAVLKLDEGEGREDREGERNPCRDAQGFHARVTHFRNMAELTSRLCYDRHECCAHGMQG